MSYIGPQYDQCHCRWCLSFCGIKYDNNNGCIRIIWKLWGHQPEYLEESKHVNIEKNQRNNDEIVELAAVSPVSVADANDDNEYCASEQEVNAPSPPFDCGNVDDLECDHEQAPLFALENDAQ